MNVFPEKRIELYTDDFLTVRFPQGCRRDAGTVTYWQSVEDENKLVLLEEWNTRKDFMTHLKSDNFKVIRGTRKPSPRTL